MTALDSIPAPDYQKQGSEVFDFSDETLVDDSIQEIQLIRSFNLAQSSNSDVTFNNYWNFQQNDLMSYYLWSRSMIKLNFVVTKDFAGAPGGLAGNNATITSDVRCAFRRIRCLIGGQVIYDQPDFNYILTSQDYAWWTKEYLETVGSEFFCMPDSQYDQYGVQQTTGFIRNYAGTPALPAIAPLNYRTSPNCGTGVRSSITTRNPVVSDGTPISAYIPLYHLIPALQFMDKALSGLQFQLELWDSDDSIRVLTPGGQSATEGGTGVWEWRNNGVELLCRRIIPTSTYKLILQEQMNKGIDMTIKFPQPNVYRFGVTEALQNREQLITTTASRPLHMVVLFQPTFFTDVETNLQTTQAYPTDYFDHFNIESMSAYINGIKVPSEGINCEINEEKPFTGSFPPFVNKENVCDASNAYYWFLKHAGFNKAPYLNNYQDGNSTIGFLDWKNKMPIYSLDLSTHEISDWAGGSSQINLRYVRGRNSAAASGGAPNYYMWVILWTESTLGIHQQTYNNYATLT